MRAYVHVRACVPRARAAFSGTRVCGCGGVSSGGMCWGGVVRRVTVGVDGLCGAIVSTVVRGENEEMKIVRYIQQKTHKK